MLPIKNTKNHKKNIFLKCYPLWYKKVLIFIIYVFNFQPKLGCKIQISYMSFKNLFSVTQRRALTKLAAVETHIVTNHRLSHGELEEFYAGVGDIFADTYLFNILEMQKYWTRRLINNLG